MVCTVKRVSECFDPYVAECIALPEGMEMVLNGGFEVSIAESDAVNVVRVANSSSSYDVGGVIVDDNKACISQIAGGIIC